MISVAMCTFNGEKYIKEQIESIINQSLVPDEIVICDDCSKDNTINIIKETLANWSGKANLIINEDNLGYRKNFEKAISLCNGDIIFLSDQDDVWDNCKVEILLKTFEKDKNIILAFHDVEVVDESLKVLSKSFWKILNFDYLTFEENNYKRLMESNVIQGSACAFKKELFNYAYPFPKTAVHDEWIGLVAILNGKVLPVKKRLAKYRQSENNVIGATEISFIEKIKKWVINVYKTANDYKAEIKRRYLLFKILKIKFPRKFNYNIHEINEYHIFLEERNTFINNKKYFKILLNLDYIKICGKNIYTLKIMLKDFITAFIS